ncbi:MAG: hypothetical protein K0Q73_5015, partial [Paenibacillus sp.]|nr:hypothetical protein [Paenibacillus sp.]
PDNRAGRVVKSSTPSSSRVILVTGDGFVIPHIRLDVMLKFPHFALDAGKVLVLVVTHFSAIPST